MPVVVDLPQEFGAPQINVTEVVFAVWIVGLVKAVKLGQGVHQLVYVETWQSHHTAGDNQMAATASFAKIII